jgi:flagellar FliL protein
MSDSDELDMDGGDSPDAGGGNRKKGGALGALLPTILKFAAIGIGALIFIVTVSVITYRVMSGGGKSQTVITDPTSPYMGSRPQYTFYTDIGTVTTRTKDERNHTVTVVMNLGYTPDDADTASELILRRYELRDFVRHYFTGKLAEELMPENEARLKKDIQESLNTRILDKAKVRLIVFDRLDVMEVD